MLIRSFDSYVQKYPKFYVDSVESHNIKVSRMKVSSLKLMKNTSILALVWKSLEGKVVKVASVAYACFRIKLTNIVFISECFSESFKQRNNSTMQKISPMANQNENLIWSFVF